MQRRIIRGRYWATATLVPLRAASNQHVVLPQVDRAAIGLPLSGIDAIALNDPAKPRDGLSGDRGMAAQAGHTTARTHVTVRVAVARGPRHHVSQLAPGWPEPRRAAPLSVGRPDPPTGHSLDFISLLLV